MSQKYGTITSYGEKLIKDAETRVLLKEAAPSIIRDYKQRLKAYCEPFFKKQSIRTITTAKLREFVKWLAERGLKATSIHGILSFVSKVLKLAAEDGVIPSVPTIPRPKKRDNPRLWLSKAEYAKLLLTLKRIEKQDPKAKVRSWEIDWELRAYTTFLVNSFLRPGDAMGLRHKDVEIVDEPDRKFLRLKPVTSKTDLGPVITMQNAVPIYRRLLEKHGKKGMAESDDYIFLPSYRSRSHAQEIFRRQLMFVFDAAGLKTTAGGQVRTPYSLRHTAIMLRLTNSKGLDLLTLARNCRTSVEMIDRFYAKHLTAEMNLEKLQSMKFPSRLNAVT